MVWIYLIFSFTHWRTSWLLSAFGSYEQSCRKHPCADLYVDLSFSAPLDKYQGVGLLEPGSGCLILQETRFYQTSFLVLLHHYYYLLWFFFFFSSYFILPTVSWELQRGGLWFLLGPTLEPEAQRQGIVVLCSLVDTLSTSCLWFPLTWKEIAPWPLSCLKYLKRSGLLLPPF